MYPRGLAVALYGRFSPGVRDRLRREIITCGGAVARDLTRRSDVFVVGALAAALIDIGALPARLRTAREASVPVLGERAFSAELSGEPGPGEATLPLGSALAQTSLSHDDAAVLAAFDLIVVADDKCRFGDQGTMRTASELLGQNRSFSEVVRILQRARDLSPTGRRRIVLRASGEAALKWEDGLTTLEGQGFLPLDDGHVGLDDLFERAALAEAAGDLEEAAHLYDQCSRADRGDAIAPYNFANIRLAQGRYDQAALAYQRALTRDPGFIEARYNLAQALEAAGKPEAAGVELDRVLESDPAYSDAMFNRAQLRMKAGEMVAAKELYERYLALDPPDEWAATARKAITYCASQVNQRP
jgi:tetratricopeptide (TPR) repeat protein